jgi:hypothetical protein
VELLLPLQFRVPTKSLVKLLDLRQGVDVHTVAAAEIQLLLYLEQNVVILTLEFARELLVLKPRHLGFP